MREEPAPQPGMITVLSLSPTADDQAVLERTFRGTSLTLYPNCRLALRPVATAAGAMVLLRQEAIPIVLCDEDALPGAWRELVQSCSGLASPPCVIVTSRNADDQLWTEVLNRGGFDLLAKPFHEPEAMRIIQSAWVRWRNRYGLTENAGGSLPKE